MSFLEILDFLLPIASFVAFMLGIPMGAWIRRKVR